MGVGTLVACDMAVASKRVSLEFARPSSVFLGGKTVVFAAPVFPMGF